MFDPVLKSQLYRAERHGHFYRVFPGDKSIRLSDLGLDLSKYDRLLDTHVLGFVYYDNLEAGVRITGNIKDDKSEVLRSLWYELTKDLKAKYSCTE